MGRILSEANRAYIAGLIDSDGAIMAWVESHSEKKYKFRIRIVVKFSQKKKEILQWLFSITGIGRIRKNRNVYEWIVKDQKHIKEFLIQISPYLRIKQAQARLALRILNSRINSYQDLINLARLADALSERNPRSRKRGKSSYTTMIEESIPRND